MLLTSILFTSHHPSISRTKSLQSIASARCLGKLPGGTPCSTRLRGTSGLRICRSRIPDSVPRQTHLPSLPVALRCSHTYAANQAVRQILAFVMYRAVPAVLVQPAACRRPAFDDGVIGFLGVPPGAPATSRYSFPCLPCHYAPSSISERMSQLPFALDFFRPCFASHSSNFSLSFSMRQSDR